MTYDFAAATRRALGVTRGGDPAGAARIIQQALAGRDSLAHGGGNAAQPGDALLLDAADAAAAPPPPADAVPRNSGRSVLQS